jgi:hypothetical protein
MKTKLFLFIGAAIIGLALAATPAAAQVQWHTNYKYDQGIQTSLAVHPSGLVLEFHRTDNLFSNTLWYHVGRLKENNTIAWGGSLRAPGIGSWPNVAITQGGYVLYMWSDAENKSQSTLYYAVGKIDPNGSEGQEIQWLTTNGRSFDAGFHSSLAMNASGLFVEAHESGTNGRGMYYRVGHLANPAGGNYDLVWNSGGNGRYYDDGVDPHIAINNNNQLVEVHQDNREHYLHYHRGTVLSNGTIDFQASQRYDDYGIEPSVALLDNGLVVEAHSEGYNNQETCSPGILSPSSPERIDWYNRVKVTGLAGGSPTMATDGTNPGPRVAVSSWVARYPNDQGLYLTYTVGTIEDR